MTSIALFNNKGGVGKTTLTYHLAHMLQRSGKRVLAVDLDPQSNLTSMFLPEDALAVFWDEPPDAVAAYPGELQVSLLPLMTSTSGTIASALKPIMEGTGDIADTDPFEVRDGLWLLPGDLNLSAFEDHLSQAWPRSFMGDVAAIRTTTAFHRQIKRIEQSTDADITLIDVGPNLGAINRAALLAADTVVMPLAADLFSLRGLRNLGPALREWRRQWTKNVLPQVPTDIPAPTGDMRPLGYVIMQPSMRLDRPVQAYQRWLDRIPSVFEQAVLGSRPPSGRHPVNADYEIATVPNYRSLMPLAHDARKPMFDLRAADGALGSTQRYVQKCYQDFRLLTEALLGRLESAGLASAS